MSLSKEIRSVWVITVILWQKVFDIFYRRVMGIPSLKRSQITANLFLGGQYSLTGLNKLKAMGITGIVNMRETSIYPEARYEGFRHLHLPTIDNTPPTLEALVTGADFIDDEIRNKGGKVYIHCRQGLGRGPSMAIAYLLKLGTTYDDAFALIRKVRTFIDPRPSQIERLKELENFYLNENQNIHQVR
ncbi:MAG: dual specificity protein phosphatase [Chryseolinea sp.]